MAVWAGSICQELGRPALAAILVVATDTEAAMLVVRAHSEKI